MFRHLRITPHGIFRTRKPLSTPAVGCDHPLELLDACHERILHFAGMVLKIARHVGEHGVDDDVKVAAGGVIRYYDDAGARHHLDEEQDLFVALLRCASPAQLETLRPLLHKLRRDHVELDALWSAMRPRLLRLANGTGTTLDVFAAEAFVEGYRRHIELEERELLPLAHRILDKATIDALGASMAARRGVRLPSS